MKVDATELFGHPVKLIGSMYVRNMMPSLGFLGAVSKV